MVYVITFTVSEYSLFFSLSFSLRIFRMAQSMIFAIEEINREGKLLPNVTLGYKIYDSCSTPYQALKAAMELMGTEQDSEVEMVDNHMCHGTVPVVIGDGGSTQSLVVARLLGAFHVPQVRCPLSIHLKPSTLWR